MPNHMKFCGCKMCRAGRHTSWNRHMIQQVIRKARRLAKQALRRGDTPDDKHSVPYTD